MKKLLAILSFEWLADFLFNLSDKADRKGRVVKLFANICFWLAFIVCSFGLFFLIYLWLHFSEGLGIDDVGIRLIMIFVVPIAISYVLHTKPWFWVINFATGIFISIKILQLLN